MLLTESELLNAKHLECLELKEALRELVEMNKLMKMKLQELIRGDVLYCSRCGGRLRMTGEACRTCDPELADKNRRRHAKAQANVRAKRILQEQELPNRDLRLVAGLCGGR